MYPKNNDLELTHGDFKRATETVPTWRGNQRKRMGARRFHRLYSGFFACDSVSGVFK